MASRSSGLASTRMSPFHHTELADWKGGSYGMHPFFVTSLSIEPQ